MSQNENDHPDFGPVILEEASALPDADAARDPLFGSAESFALTNAKHVALDAILKLLTRNLKFNEFVRDLLLIFMGVVKSEAGSILEVDHKNKAMFFRAVVGQSSDTITQFTVPLGQGIAGYVAESLQPLIVSDMRENRIHLKAIERAIGFETRNLVAMPLVVRGRVYGVLELLNRVGEDTYTAQDVELLTYLCEAASRALEIRMMIAWTRQQSQKKATGEAA